MTLVLPSKVTGWLICTKARLSICPCQETCLTDKDKPSLKGQGQSKVNKKNEDTVIVCLAD